MDDITIFKNNSITLDQTPKVKAFKVKDLLLDERSLLQNELRSLLESDIELAQPERMNELISLLLRDFEDSGNNFKSNTLRSLNQNWAHFCSWCQDRQFVAIPCSVDQFQQYIVEHKTSVKLSTLKTYSWAVQTMHLASGLPSPTEPIKIKKLLQKIESQKLGEGEYVRQASAFNETHLSVLHETFSTSSRLIELRDLALITVAYESMLRESELTRATFEQLTFHRDGRGILLIPITKSRHSGEPDKVILSLECLAVIDAYVELAGIERSGFIFRRVHKSNKIGHQTNPLSGFAIDNIFAKAFTVVARISPQWVRGKQPWSGHSARVGACQDLLAAGYSPLEVQVSGRWSSPTMVYRYGRDILAEDGAMAKFRAKKK